MAIDKRLIHRSDTQIGSLQERLPGDLGIATRQPNQALRGCLRDVEIELVCYILDETLHLCIGQTRKGSYVEAPLRQPALLVSGQLVIAASHDHIQRFAGPQRIEHGRQPFPGVGGRVEVREPIHEKQRRQVRADSLADGLCQAVTGEEVDVQVVGFEYALAGNVVMVDGPPDEFQGFTGLAEARWSHDNQAGMAQKVTDDSGATVYPLDGGAAGECFLQQDLGRDLAQGGRRPGLSLQRQQANAAQSEQCGQAARR